MDSNEPLAHAVEGVVKELALDLGVSLSRMYEILGKDNCSSKLWRVLAVLAHRKPEGLRFYQADFNARCEALLAENSAPVTAAQLHKELSDVVQAHLSDKSADEQRRELIEAVSVCQHRLDDLNALNTIN